MPTDEEYRQTSILALALEECSAKVRTGPPKDDETDLELPVWAGVVPMSMVPGAPVADDEVPSGTQAPGYATGYRRPGANGG